MTSNWLFFFVFFVRIRCCACVCRIVSADSCVITSLTWCAHGLQLLSLSNLCPSTCQWDYFYYQWARMEAYGNRNSSRSRSMSTTSAEIAFRLWIQWWMRMHLYRMRSLFLKKIKENERCKSTFSVRGTLDKFCILWNFVGAFSPPSLSLLAVFNAHWSPRWRWYSAK